MARVEGMEREEELKKSIDRELLGKLFRFSQPYRWIFAVAVVMLLFVTGLNLAQPYIIKVAIDTAFVEKDIAAILRLGMLLLVVVAASFVFNLGQTYLLNYASERIVLDVRHALFKHLQSMPVSFFDANPVGRLVTRVTNDTEKIKEFFTNVAVSLLKDAVLLLGIIGVMFSLNVKLALVSMVTLPGIAFSAAIYRSKSREAYRQARIKLAEINAHVQENISGIRVIKAFNREKAKEAEFDALNREHFKYNMEELMAFAVFRPLMDIFVALTLAFLLWFGGGDVIRGSIQLGVLYAFINYAQQFFHPINDFTEKYNILQSALAASEKVFLLLDEEPDILEPEKPYQLDHIQGDIRFENVWFAYNPGEWVLKDVSFHIQPGETVGIVGATGAGKSTMTNLILRFYDVQQGSVLIDGIDVRRLDLSCLRRRIGIVLQDVFLFAGTIRENIALHNDLSEEAVEELILEVGADFIKHLPEQYDTEVKERGLSLSVGERQLLSFARALAVDPDMLILDEATASVDTETEAGIQKILEEAGKDRTTVIIAHRLSTVRNADRILVLHKGRLEESGTHEELLRKKGFYYKLYQYQSKENALAVYARPEKV